MGSVSTHLILVLDAVDPEGEVYFFTRCGVSEGWPFGMVDRITARP
jgi:hypothetical protein